MNVILVERNTDAQPHIADTVIDQDGTSGHEVAIPTGPGHLEHLARRLAMIDRSIAVYRYGSPEAKEVAQHQAAMASQIGRLELTGTAIVHEITGTVRDRYVETPEALAA